MGLQLVLPAILLALSGLASAERYDVTPLQFFSTRGAALSNTGVVAAGIVNPDGSVSLGEWSNGLLTKLGAPAGLPVNFNRVRPFGINNSGAIVGTVHTSAGDLPARSFVYSGGKFTTLPLVNSTDLGGVAIGINAKGAVVGYDNTTSSHAAEGWLWSNGVYSGLPVSGTSTAALGINSSGTIIGNRTVSLIRRLLSGQYCCAGPSGYVVSHGTTQYLTGPVNAINDPGEVAGASNAGSDARATVFNHGIGIAILSVTSSAIGINSSGDVVGSYQPPGYHSRIFIWSQQSGAFDLTPDGYRYAVPSAINGRGDILGFGETTSGTFQYFLLMPARNGVLTPKQLITSPPAVAAQPAAPAP
jgi:hypothetical protein